MTEVLENQGVEPQAELNGYARAIAAADKLRQHDRQHELLRFVAKGLDAATADRLDQERLERFWRAKTNDAHHNPSVADVDAETFNAIASAMEEALSPVPTIRYERVRVVLDPAIDVFNVDIEHSHPPGVYTYTAPSQEHLNAFLEGARAVMGCMGLHISIPREPTNYKPRYARLESTEPLPQTAAAEEEELPL